MSDDDEFIADFRAESLDGLSVIEAHIMGMEAGNPEAVKLVFRALHSMKGGSSFFDLNHINQVAHQLENLLDEVRDGTRAITPGLIDLLLNGRDLLETMLGQNDCGESMDITPILTAIATVQQEGSTAPAPPAGAPTADPVATAAASPQPAPAPTPAPRLEPAAPKLDERLATARRTLETEPPFGTFLVAHGKLDADTVLDALRDQEHQCRHPFDCLRQVGLAAATCLDIANLAHQLDRHPFEIADQLGLVDHEQLAALWAQQRASRPPLGQILVEMGAVQTITMRVWLQEYFDQRAGKPHDPTKTVHLRPQTSRPDRPATLAPPAEELLPAVALPTTGAIIGDQTLLDEFQSFFNGDFRDKLEKAFVALDQLETQAAALTPHLQQLYRDLHSLKGCAGFIGADCLSVVIHHLEDCVGTLKDQAQAGATPACGRCVSVALAALDHCWSLRCFILAERDEGPYLEQQAAQLHNCLSELAACRQACSTAPLRRDQKTGAK